jgi:hypothetical protein
VRQAERKTNGEVILPEVISPSAAAAKALKHETPVTIFGCWRGFQFLRRLMQ